MSAPPIKWHAIFAAMLRELLTQVQVRVLDEFTVTGEVDIVLIQLLEGTQWTPEQRQYLPDGLRDSPATHLLIEFKYSESLNKECFRQAIAYDTLYRRLPENSELSVTAIQTFIVSAKTTQTETLTQFGYQPTEQEGVYTSQNILLADIPILLLNKLSDEQYNAFFKLFASHRRAKLAAMGTLQTWGLQRLKGQLFWLIKGLLNLWLQKGDELMEAITAETLIEKGKHITDWLEPLLTEEDILQLSAGQQVYRKGHQEGREEGREKGREEGREKGREEGAAQEILALLLRTLPRLFKEMPPTLTAQLAQLSLPQLRQAVDLAFEVDNLATFEAQITAWIAK